MRQGHIVTIPRTKCYSLKIIQQNKKIIKRNKNMSHSQQMNVNKKFRRLVKC